MSGLAVLAIGACSYNPSAASSPALAQCRLPVVTAPEPVLPIEAHYVSFPGGEISVGAADVFTYVEDGYAWRSSNKPTLRGTGPVGYYDSALNRFLPVQRTQVSSDGRQYAYTDWSGPGGLWSTGLVHIVEVATGSDRTLNLPATSYNILDFSPEGIYFNYGPRGDPGLWLLDPNSGETRQLFREGWVAAVADGAAWLTVNHLDLHRTTSYYNGETPGPPKDVLLRRDLKSGQVTEWLRPVGLDFKRTDLRWLGLSNGTVVVGVLRGYLRSSQTPSPGLTNIPDGFEVLLVSGPGAAERVDAGSISNVDKNPWVTGGFRFHALTSDRHGIWLGGDAIYLYQRGAGLTKIASFAGFPGNACL